MKQALVHIGTLWYTFFRLHRNAEKRYRRRERSGEEEKKDVFSPEAHHAPALCSSGKGTLVAHATG